MQLVILCGGLGTRLREIDDKNPKSLIEINNKPFIHYLLNSIEKYPFTSIHFCLGYKSENFINYINKINKFEFKKISFSVEDEKNLLGTGGAIKNCLEFLNNNFIVQYGDTILKFNYEKFYKYHLSHKEPMTMSIMKATKTLEQANLFCEINKENELQCIYNKLNPPFNANYIDYGAIVFKKELFDKIEKDIFDLSEIQAKLSKQKKAKYFETDYPYTEIGNPRSFREALDKLNDF